jgi:ABC-type transport system involved in cytochrome bd biosynthesis fused ATPase/permease subunit
VLQQLHWKQDLNKFSDSSKEILHGLTLKIEQGERIAIYGANGSGKTTSFVFYLVVASHLWVFVHQ